MNFKLIDPLIGVFSGIIIAFSVFNIVPGQWHMIVGMLAGGVLGMALKFVLLIFLLPFFGAFEVMIPLTIIAMVTGMASGMASAHGGVPEYCIIVTGGIVGLVVSLLIQHSHNKLAQVE